MYFIDVQGTLISDDTKEPIDGAIEFIDYLNSSNTPYIVITNNTKNKSEEFLEFLHNKGFDIPKKNYLDPFSILKQSLKVKNIIAFGEESFIEVLESMGYIIDENSPQALLISIKRDYTNEDYAKMIEYASKGIEIIGMHETSIYAKNGKKYPGVGAIMQLISYAVNRPYEVVGKPSVKFYEKARELLDTNFTDITIISDDMVGDIKGAMRLGMRGVFVLSGKIKDKNEILPTLQEDEQPNEVYQNIGEYYWKMKKD
ncbi:MAG: HAD-IIA family hydrolase [Arcobacteraceae bacterium]|jgi:NagD protein|nr:HAD-IIA family hydrolase [Arcobacteraceae bacterium]